MVTKGLHRQNADSLLDRDRHDILGKRAEMRIHDIYRHLYSVEMKAVLLGHGKHAEMYRWIFMPGKPDVTNLAHFPCCNRSLKRSAGRKDAVRVFQPDHFVKLREVDHIGLQAPERLLQLKVVSLFGSAIHLGHQENLAAIAVAQCLTHADFTNSVVVVPAVVHEGDAAVDRGSNQAHAFRGIGLFTEVIATQAYHRNLLSSVPQN